VANVLLSVVLSGLMLGGVYALISSGLNMIYGVMKIINFAQGEFVMLGMYITYWLNFTWKLDPFLTLFITAPAGFALGVVIQRLIIERTFGHPIFVQTVATFGLLLILQNSALIFWGASFRTIESPFSSSSFEVLGGVIPLAPFIAFIGATIIIFSLYLLLTRTVAGMALRATSENQQVARLLGIGARRMNYLAFGIAGLTGFVSGTFLSTYFYIYPTVGAIFILRAFIIVVLGGMGNIFGALAGGIVIGESEALGGFIFGPQWSEFISLVIFVLVLLLRPSGIFGVRLK
jgi:branched-chain amino acid transport system permease protein